MSFLLFPYGNIFRLASHGRHWTVMLMEVLLYIVIFLVCVYLLRHYRFTLNRLFGKQRHPYLDVDTADWPEVTVMVPAHNEEGVISEILQALLEVDYPTDKLTIMPVNDRSEDRTGEIISSFALSRSDVIIPFNRTGGEPGKGAALRDATERVDNDLILVFDADYIPGRGLIKQLVSPFFDPEVGAVMGRVVPTNAHVNLLTRMLDLERSGGYQVDQQARMNLHLVPQYGGTVGGIRKSALMDVGGWGTDTLAEDTDATYRLLLGGWKTVYQNRSECYELVPENWPSRIHQIMRWAKGHNQTMARYFWPLTQSRRTGFREKIDGLLLLGVYAMSPILLVGWLLAISLWYLGVNKPGLIIILAVTCYGTFGNFATFFELAAAARLDGSRERIKLIPLVLLGFLVSLYSISRASFSQLIPTWGRERKFKWDKTEHSHNTDNSGNGNGNGGNNGFNGRNGGRNGNNGFSGRNGGRNGNNGFKNGDGGNSKHGGETG
jgi:cellulose synthase/poly-beta-1,6-N-acetylglucosamine synthase-like glycosyltransferase